MDPEGVIRVSLSPMFNFSTYKASTDVEPHTQLYLCLSIEMHATSSLPRRRCIPARCVDVSRCAPARCRREDMCAHWPTRHKSLEMYFITNIVGRITIKCTRIEVQSSQTVAMRRHAFDASEPTTSLLVSMEPI